MTKKWDPLRAELADTTQAYRQKRRQRKCIYCGKLTRALSGICADHPDVAALEGNRTR